MNRDRLRSVGPWKEQKLSEAAEPPVSSGEPQRVESPFASPFGSVIRSPDPSPDPVFSLVAEMIDAQAEHLEAMVRMLNGQALMLRRDAERVRSLG